jgi:hypothetical protein
MQGFIEGLCGGGLALAALFVLHQLVVIRAAQTFPGIGSEAVMFLDPALSIGLLVLAAFLGVIGSFLSVSRYPHGEL